MTALHLAADRLGSATAVFIDSFMREGRIYEQDEDINTTMTVEEIYEGIGKCFPDGMNIIANGITTSNNSRGAIKLYVGNQGTHRYVHVEMIAEPFILQAIKAFIYSKPYSRVRTTGVYDIDICHFYLDKVGNTKQITHHLDTEDFAKLIAEMYPLIDIPSMMKMYSESDECNMILTGEPGTGKTCFAKMMMAAHAKHQECDIQVIYVKDRELLKKDEFWAQMSNMRPDMMILDDLDDELRPRTEARNEIVNNMLSYSDGIFDVDTKIIITTNLTDNSIDKALIRPGRCFDILSLPQLTGQEAELIWTDTLGAPMSEFNLRFGQAPKKISQAAIMSEHARMLKSSAPTYLRDPKISIRQIVEA